MQSGTWEWQGEESKSVSTTRHGPDSTSKTAEGSVLTEKKKTLRLLGNGDKLRATDKSIEWKEQMPANRIAREQKTVHQPTTVML